MNRAHVQILIIASLASAAFTIRYGYTEEKPFGVNGTGKRVIALIGALSLSALLVNEILRKSK